MSTVSTNLKSGTKVTKKAAKEAEQRLKKRSGLRPC